MYKSSQIITNKMLFEKFVTPQIEQYYYIKLKNEDSNYVKLKLCELLKFLTICHNVNSNIPFNDEIDEMWHLWILQTVQYKELMEKLPGKKFIHHCSNDYENYLKDNIDKDEEAHKEFSYLVSYVQNFGDFTEEAEKFWPMIDKLKHIMQINLNELNKYLREIYYEQSAMPAVIASEVI